MREERLAAQIRAAFDSTHVPDPGLENRVVSAIPWSRSAERTASMPRAAGVVAATLALLAVAILVAPTLLSRLNIQIAGSGNGPEPPAYSLAAVSGRSVYIVQRGVGVVPGQPARNVLMESGDGGRTWTDRLHFDGIYDGMQVLGTDGFIWSIDMQSPGCKGAEVGCTPPSWALKLYRTTDEGTTWTALPATDFPVNDAFFLDASRGWAVSSSPQTGPSVEVLYETTNGGESWARVGALPQPAPNGQIFGVGLYRVTFNQQSDGSVKGWYVGATQLNVTVDAGRSWKPVAIPVPAAVAGWALTPMQPAFSGQEGILPLAYHDPAGPDNATANRIYLYLSHDGGSTWGDPRPAPAGFSPVGDDISISILDSQHVWLTSLSLSGGDQVQASPAVAQTSDAGLHWTVVRNTPRILQMAFGDGTHGFALDVSGATNVNGILSTSDGGATWQRVDVPVLPAG